MEQKYRYYLLFDGEYERHWQAQLGLYVRLAWRILTCPKSYFGAEQAEPLPMSKGEENDLYKN